MALSLKQELQAKSKAALEKRDDPGQKAKLEAVIAEIKNRLYNSATKGKRRLDVNCIKMANMEGYQIQVGEEDSLEFLYLQQLSQYLSDEGLEITEFKSNSNNNIRLVIEW